MARNAARYYIREQRKGVKDVAAPFVRWSVLAPRLSRNAARSHETYSPHKEDTWTDRTDGRRLYERAWEYNENTAGDYRASARTFAGRARADNGFVRAGGGASNLRVRKLAASKERDTGTSFDVSSWENNYIGARKITISRSFGVLIINEAFERTTDSESHAENVNADLSVDYLKEIFVSPNRAAEPLRRNATPLYR